MNFGSFASQAKLKVEHIPLKLWEDSLKAFQTPNGQAVQVVPVRKDALLSIPNHESVNLIVSGKNPEIIGLGADGNFELKITGKSAICVVYSGRPSIVHVCEMGDFPQEQSQIEAALRKDFARFQLSRLKAMGLTPVEANRLIDAAKVTASVDAAKWFFDEIDALQDINEDKTPAKAVSAMKKFLTGIFICWAKEVAFRLNTEWTQVAKSESDFFDLLLSGKVEVRDLVRSARTDIETERYEPIEGSDRHFILQLRGVFVLISILQARLRNEGWRSELQKSKAA